MKALFALVLAVGLFACSAPSPKVDSTAVEKQSQSAVKEMDKANAAEAAKAAEAEGGVAGSGE
jgi:hypothetical protein